MFLLTPQSLRGFALLLLTYFLVASCHKSHEEESKSGDFIEYISAYTSGAISKESQIRIVLAKPVDDFPGVGKKANEDLLDFEPNIKGELSWNDSRTLVFTPAAELPSGQLYQATFNLKELTKEVPENLSSFIFNFQVITQSFNPININLKTYNNADLSYYRLIGEVLSADVADADLLNGLLGAKQNGKKLNVTWRQNADRKSHSFVVDSIARVDEAGEIVLSWGEDVARAEELSKIEVPALGDFKVVGVSLNRANEQYITINFSDPLLEEQNIKGLVAIERVDNPQFIVNGNVLEVYTNKMVNGERLVSVYPGIKNAAGFALKETYETRIEFADLKPAIELIGSGNIIPQNGGLTMPFKAVNLSAVDVYILKVFSSNVPQFLQVNKLEGDYQLKRVGRPIAYKKVELATAGANLKQWNNFSIDLSEIISPEPGAIYRIELKMRPQYSLYVCEGEEETNDDELVAVEQEELNTSEYDGPDNYYWDDYYYYDYYDYDYDYRQRDNPCNGAYYTSRRTRSRNVLATNLALTVKGNDQGNFHAFVTDIISGQPINAAQVEFFNYQHQSLGKATTNSEGAVELALPSKPFLAVATAKEQFAYLRVDDGSSLSLSNFDVSGSKTEKGLKGFIYAERGVWRPGDTVHTQFMLTDDEGKLPENHPVIFEVRNPDGKMVERQVRTSHVGNIYSFHFSTEQAAKTGFYTATVKVGGVRFSKSLRIETIKPNRLKVNLSFDDEVLTGASVNGQLHANWLTGATARNLKADINMQIKQSQKPFDGFEKFDFVDETRSFYTSDKEVFKGQINETGDANAQIDIGSFNSAPGMLEAVFVTRVFEPGGDASFDRQALKYAPFTHFAGLQVEKPQNSPWLQTDSPIRVQVGSVTADGKKASRKVTASVYSIDWSWWWGSGRNGMANYLNSSYAKRIGTYQVNTSNGRGQFEFQVDYPKWGNYLVRVCDEKSGHCASQIIYVDWPMSRNRNGRANPGAPTMLTFTADKDEYNTGDIARLTIPTSDVGRLLVSLETGSKVLKHFWVDANKGQTEIEVEVTDEMTPNVYAFVSLIQPHANTENDLPIRLYGVIPIKVNNEKTKLQPVISTPEEWEPETMSTVKVSEANGRSMTYTLAIVDEGLLDITRFKTPDPWHHFYAREALGVKTWDYFDDIMGAFGGVIEQNFAIGGDQELDLSGKKRLNRFTPVVKVLGPFSLKDGQTATHNFKMPNYIGSVRVMVVARQADKYGNAEKAVPVRKPLMVLATLPRVAGPGEKIKLPVQVFAMKDHIKNVSVQARATNMLSIKNGKAELTFDEVGDQMTYFEIEVGEGIGKGIVDVSVQSGSEKATYQVELDVRNPNMLESRTTNVVIKPGESSNLSLEKFGTKGTNAVRIQASGIPDLNMADALTYLLGYPHGCTEQTISKAFPQLYLAELTNLTAGQKRDREQNVMYALNKIQANQIGGGGLTLWPSSNTVHDYTSSYACHFILEAEKKGFTVSGGVKDRLVSYLSASAQSWQPAEITGHYYNYFNQAYRLYVLALAGKPNIGAMNRLRNQNLTKSTAYRLAAAYAIAGQKSVAQSLIKNEYYLPTTRYYDPTFGNAMRASSMYLETYMLLGDDEKAFEQAIVLANELNEQHLYSSQSTAYALYSMAKFLENRKSDVLKFEWKAGKLGEQVSQAKQFYLQELTSFESEFEITNNGASDLYVSVVQSGQPLPGKESVQSNAVNVRVSYVDLSGAPIDVTNLKQGTDFKAIVTLSSSAERYKLYDMALQQVFASGWEISNTRLLDVEDVSGSSSAQYRDVRDDRVYTYFSIYNTSSRTYEVKLNASYIGKFYLPGPRVEAMYYQDVRANAMGKWVNVTP